MTSLVDFCAQPSLTRPPRPPSTWERLPTEDAVEQLAWDAETQILRDPASGVLMTVVGRRTYYAEVAS